MISVWGVNPNIPFSLIFSKCEWTVFHSNFSFLAYFSVEDSRRFSSLEMKGVTGAFYHSSIYFLVVCRAGVDYVLSFA